ncbi:MAG TPA: hypothetical protein VH475_00995 [Tepidisphaeraceae bacterium]|jgi:hypothetical protein
MIPASAALAKAHPRRSLGGIIDAMRHPDFELDTEAASGVIAAFNRARAAGMKFHPFTCALIDVLKRQLASTFDDSDEDGADDDKPLTRLAVLDGDLREVGRVLC